MYKKHFIAFAIFAAVAGIIFMTLKTKDLAAEVWKIEKVVLSALDKSGVKNRELVSRDVGKWRGIRLRGKTVKYVFEHTGEIDHAAIKANIEKTIAKMRAVDLRKAVYQKTPGKRPEAKYEVTFYTRPAVVVVVRGKTKVPLSKPKKTEAPKAKEVKPAVKSVVKPAEVKPKVLPPVVVEPKVIPPAEVKPKEIPVVEAKPKILPPAEVKPKVEIPKETKPKPAIPKESKPKVEAPKAKEIKPKTKAPEKIKPKFSFFGEAKPKTPAPKAVKPKAVPPKVVKPKPAPVKVEPVKEVKSVPKTEPAATERPPGKIAIVLDDFGYTKNNLSTLQAAGIPVTMAILPSDPFTNAACEFARKNGYEVIIHMPMEPENKNVGLEKGTILTTMDGRTIRQTIDKAFSSVLGAKGLNNHMGSKATSDKRVMRIVMETLKSRGKYFLDSRTANSSVALAAAIEAGIPHVGRDLFLDSKPGREFVASQLMAAERLAGRGSNVVVIGHDRTDTINVLREMGPEMKSRGVRFVRLSELVSR